MTSPCVIFSFDAAGRGSDRSFPACSGATAAGAPAPSLFRHGCIDGPAHDAIEDEHSQPIADGGFVGEVPVFFFEIARQAGLDIFHLRSGTAEKDTILETPSSGVAPLDYDNDGWLDICLVDGWTVAAAKGLEPAPRATLFHQ